MAFSRKVLSIAGLLVLLASTVMWAQAFPVPRAQSVIVETDMPTEANKSEITRIIADLAKKYGIKNEKAHSAASDVKTTKEVFEKQVAFFKIALLQQYNA